MVTAPILLIVVLFATGLQSLSFGWLYADPRYDTRTRAGEWIAQNSPAGATVGVNHEPWQFEVPPLNARNFLIIEHLVAYTGHLPEDFLVISDLQFAGVEGLQREHDFTSGYAVTRRFKAWPPGLRRHGPQDMQYASPGITVFKRMAKDGR